MKRCKRAHFLVCGFTLLCNCQPEIGSEAKPTRDITRSAFIDDSPTAFRDSEPIGPLEALAVTRPDEDASDVIERARAMAVVITQDESLPTGTSIDASTLGYWEDAARSQAHRPGTINIYLNGHHLSATYLPATNTLSVLSKDTVDRNAQGLVAGEKAEGLGRDEAQRIAEGCVDELATLGAISPRTYSRNPVQAGERVTSIGEFAWVEQYDFVFAPKPGGVPLRSMDLRVGVAAQSGRCRSLTISIVEFEDAGEVNLVTSAAEAKQFVESAVAQDPLVDSVSVEGYVGYLLEPDRDYETVAPRYIASYVTISELEGQTLVSREKTAAVSLTGVPKNLEPIYDW